MEKERILQKIKHCLALSKSANENEAAMALRQAHALMEKYGVSMSDMSMADISSKQTKGKVPQKPPKHLAILINQIAKMFGCEAILTTDNNWHVVVEFVGFDAYPEIASYAFDVLSRQLANSRKQYIDTELKRVKKRANKTARADSYCYGWVIAVARKISDLVPPSVDRELLEQHVKNNMGKTEKRQPRDRSKAVAAKRSEQNDINSGIRDGKKAQLHNAMSGSDTKKIGVL